MDGKMPVHNISGVRKVALPSRLTPLLTKKFNILLSLMEEHDPDYFNIRGASLSSFPVEERRLWGIPGVWHLSQ